MAEEETPGKEPGNEQHSFSQDDPVRARLVRPIDVSDPRGAVGGEISNAKRQKARPKQSREARFVIENTEFAAEAEVDLGEDFLVDNFLDKGSIAVVYGPANSGKSFLTTNLAAAVDSGRPFAGHKVNQARAYYFAMEGGRKFRNRLVAAGARFPYNLCSYPIGGPGSYALPIADAVNHLAEVQGPFGLIVVDTLAMAMTGADENSSVDIGHLIRGVKLIRDRTGAAVLLVHHSGKDREKGARGHSALRAAIDTEIEILPEDDGVRLARVRKQRDLPAGAEYPFRLEQVVLGKRSDGVSVTSCKVEFIKGGKR